MGKHVGQRRPNEMISVCKARFIARLVGIVEGKWRACMTMRQQVEETIEVIRPALQADGGDIILREVDEVTEVVQVA